MSALNPDLSLTADADIPDMLYNAIPSFKDHEENSKAFENIAGEGEKSNAGNQHFLLFPTRFCNTFTDDIHVYDIQMIYMY